jgi:hydrogenase nickel incorporation protein HypA/HybF
MHELSIAQEVVSIVLKHLPTDTEPSVKAVKMRIGKMTNVLPDSLQFCFESLIAGTAMEGARLEIEHVPVGLHCEDCDAVMTIDGFTFSCPACGGNNVLMVSGQELNVVEIELNDAREEVV